MTESTEITSIYLFAFAGIYVVSFYLWNGANLCQNKMIRFILFFNPLVLREMWYNWNHAIVNVVLVSAIIYNQRNRNFNTHAFHMLLSSFIVGANNPTLVPVIAMQFILQTSNAAFLLDAKKKETIKVISLFKQKVAWMMTICVLFLSLLSVYYINYQVYFSQYFEPSLGITWIIYSHMFHRYLYFFQTIIMLVPYIAFLPILLTQCPSYLKLSIVYFLSIFSLPNVCYSHFFGLIVIQIYAYRELINNISRTQKIGFNAFLILGILLNIFSLIIYQRTLKLWLSSHVMSIGFPFAQNLLFQGSHSLCLAEALSLNYQINQKPNSHKQYKYGKMRRIIQNLANYLKKCYQTL